jgi:membrane fusion protein, copper/silver efflux system
MKRQNEKGKMKNSKVKKAVILHFAFCTLTFAMILPLPIVNAFAQDHPGHGTAQAPQQKPKKAAQPQVKEQEPAPTITLSSEKRQLIGVRTAVAGYRSLDRQVRTVGKVDVDETRLAFVNTKVAGWVKKLYIDYTGQKVVKGQPLLSIYSPDLVTAQEEYLLALRSQSAAAAPGGFSEVAASQQSLIDSAKRRLFLWDITEEQIAELEKSGKPKTDITLQAPLDGIVIEKMVLEGAYVMSGMNLYKIADLSNVWIIADVYEYEAPLVTVGQEARVSLAYEPGESFTAAVIFISPVLDPTTRTIKVRLAAKNPHLKLKPEMFANVDIKASSGARLAIPAEAVLDSGLRQIVYVEKQPGVFEMREVKLGVRGETYVEVLSGIRKGERVVSSGNFLIDSESQLRAGPGGGGHQH